MSDRTANELDKYKKLAKSWRSRKIRICHSRRKGVEIVGGNFSRPQSKNFSQGTAELSGNYQTVIFLSFLVIYTNLIIMIIYDRRKLPKFMTPLYEVRCWS